MSTNPGAMPNLPECTTDDRRWLLVIEIQKCCWASPEEMPEVDIQYAEVIASYSCEQDAYTALNKYLNQVSATAQWSDVRPVETCACCGADLDTTKWHKVLVLSVEEGNPYNPDFVDVKYPARFCNGCVPLTASKAFTRLPQPFGAAARRLEADKVFGILTDNPIVIKDRLTPMPSIERRNAIESALIGALYHVRTGDTTQAKHIATGKAVTAARLLKQACEQSNTNGGRATA